MELAQSLGWKLADKTGSSVPATQLQGKVVALYFSAHWCPPCRGFTPNLKKFYEGAKMAGCALEIVFVSSDKSESEGLEYFRGEHGDWLMLDFAQKGDLGERYEVRGIPSLVIVEPSGKAAAVSDARSQVAEAANSGLDAVKAVVQAWEQLCGDWRQTAGNSLGGASGGDAEYMRACRLARLEGREPPPPPTAAPIVTPPAPVAALTTPVASAVPDAAKASQLTDMGFNAEQAAQALASTNGDVESAAAVLLGGDAADVQASETNGPVEVPEAAVEQLVAMGFAGEQARQALTATGGNIENAMAILLGD